MWQPSNQWTDLDSTRFFYDGWNVVEEHTITAGTQTLARTFTWGSDLSGALQGAGGVGGLLLAEEVSGGNTTARHYHYDGNGNVTEITDLAGAKVASYRYDAYGNTLAATGPYSAQNRYRFSTKPLDSEITGAPLYYYGYRYYDPITGSWQSRDPVEEEGGVNLYGFTINDGVNWFDYLGLATLTANVDRYARTKEAIYSVVTVSSDDADVNKCCCLPKSFAGIERGTDETENLLDEGSHSSAFNGENSPPFGPKNKTGAGLTSISGRVAKHGGRWPISIPEKPPGMNQSDYNQAIENEYRTGDGGDNLHGGPNQNHSSGCVLLGTCMPGNGGFDSYQGSLEADLDFKAAVACAKRKSKGISIKTKVSKLPSITKGPIIPKALPVSPCEQ